MRNCCFDVTVCKPVFIKLSGVLNVGQTKVQGKCTASFASMQYVMSGLSPEFKNVYLFHGVPDITFHKSIYVQINDDEEGDLDPSINDCVVENTKIASALVSVPSKLGQLFAGSKEATL